MSTNLYFKGIRNYGEVPELCPGKMQKYKNMSNQGPSTEEEKVDEQEEEKEEEEQEEEEEKHYEDMVDGAILGVMDDDEEK